MAEQMQEDIAIRSKPSQQQGTERTPSGDSSPQEKKPARTLMLQGTASDVGKSLLTAALCRIAKQDGYAVAPFKSQNMSLNSYVTPDGKEIGRAQGMQADACGIPASTDMNPILLKPSSDMASQVVVHGRPLATMDALEYRNNYLQKAEPVVKEALDRLRSGYDLVVLEGAGSPAEVNLKDRDIVNMRLAGWADAPVLLVADIDRGGVFASIVGTLEILEPEERDRIKGFLINKFRGDVTLLKSGLDWLEQRTGKPVLGVIPFLPNVTLEDEDSLSLQHSARAQSMNISNSLQPQKLDIAVIRLPRISNFTDADPLWAEEDVALRYVSKAEEFGCPDAVLLPGTKNTLGDLAFLTAEGLDLELTQYAAAGGWMAGICGGYQMMGLTLSDPYGADSGSGMPSEAQGLGVFPLHTVFSEEKTTVRSQGLAAHWDEGELLPVEGYEIHMGQTETEPVGRTATNGTTDTAANPLLTLADGTKKGVITRSGRQWGTYLHGILHNDEFRRSWLNAIRRSKGWEPIEGSLKFRERREAEFDRLADHVRQHVRMDLIYSMVHEESPGPDAGR
ncbi:cobyric acid synthase [Paenibacillus gansuensis]|uniref:Cobyric acid synthase n=1 Tax=Paenibacillus gansuensis TaxID=306542 RepID=A0ABW5P7C0_9BACL